jgi:hypothetical protein
VIWWLVVIWLVVVGVPTVYVGLKAARTAQRMNKLQVQIQAIMAELQTEKLVLLARRQAELQANLERLTAAMNSLQRSLDTLRVLIDRWKAAIAPVRFFLRFLRA